MLRNTDEGREIEYGGFWRRTVALQFDCLLSYAIPAFVWAWVCHITDIDANFLKILCKKYPLFTYFILIIPSWLYFVGFHSSKWQATPGMQLLDLQIVGEDCEKISIFFASIRFVSSILMNILTIFPMLLLPSKRTFHDLAGSSYVIIKEKRPVVA